MRTHILVIVSALLCPAATAAAQVSGSPWFVRLDGGVAKIHATDGWDPAGAVRVGRYLDQRRMAAVLLSAAGSSADAGYGTLELGVELQLPGSPRVTPFIGGRAGLLLEEGFGGDVLEGHGGLAFRIGTGQWLRLTAQLGRHSDAKGPHAFLIGWQAPL
jgi:hypothetical protein